MQTQTATSSGVSTVPQIQQKPRIQSESAIHYGYCAFKDIALAGAAGMQHKVQPGDSPYYLKLPARQLIPFTNIEVSEVNEQVASLPGYVQGGNTMQKVPHSAYQCAFEMESAYEDWGFRILYPITGFSETDAFNIFIRIQPAVYKLKNILSELDEGAKTRIESDSPLDVMIDGETVQVPPLRDDLRRVAEETRAVMYLSAERAVLKGEETLENSIRSLSNFFAGGTGKNRPDPHDKYLGEELNQGFPSALNFETQQQQNQQAIPTESAESLELKRKAIELQERQIALEERKIALAEQEAAARLPMASSTNTPATAVTTNTVVVSETVPPPPAKFAIGDNVVADGRAGVVIAKPFGRYTVQFDGAEEKTYDLDKLEPFS